MGIRARNADGESAWVHTATAAAPEAPAAVSAVNVTRNASGLSASWDTPAWAASYDVEYQASDELSWTTAATGHTATGLTISSVDETKTYKVRVQANNVTGSSAWTESAAVSPQ